ncbi:Hypothetical_protein [Hexamita inflata]|uniref:Hypothetical_protein n=1 Tax=Hexamita inflata TaxID=28002 RepID=A0AA86QUR1_9EUKA|nr:Hypothetical protein HINF_LOCUS54036 [Hexamita inflata]
MKLELILHIIVSIFSMLSMNIYVISYLLDTANNSHNTNLYQNSSLASLILLFASIILFFLHLITKLATKRCKYSVPTSIIVLVKIALIILLLITVFKQWSGSIAVSIVFNAVQIIHVVFKVKNDSKELKVVRRAELVLAPETERIIPSASEAE